MRAVPGVHGRCGCAPVSRTPVWGPLGGLWSPALGQCPATEAPSAPAPTMDRCHVLYTWKATRQKDDGLLYRDPTFCGVAKMCLPAPGVSSGSGTGQRLPPAPRCGGCRLSTAPQACGRGPSDAASLRGHALQRGQATMASSPGQAAGPGLWFSSSRRESRKPWSLEGHARSTSWHRTSGDAAAHACACASSPRPLTLGPPREAASSRRRRMPMLTGHGAGP